MQGLKVKTRLVSLAVCAAALSLAVTPAAAETAEGTVAVGGAAEGGVQAQSINPYRVVAWKDAPVYGGPRQTAEHIYTVRAGQAHYVGCWTKNEHNNTWYRIFRSGNPTGPPSYYTFAGNYNSQVGVNIPKC